MKNLKIIGIDISQHVFHLFGIDGKGRKVFKKICNRKGLPKFIETLPKHVLIVMEACGGANFRGSIHRLERLLYEG